MGRRDGKLGRQRTPRGTGHIPSLQAKALQTLLQERRRRFRLRRHILPSPVRPPLVQFTGVLGDVGEVAFEWGTPE